MENLSESLKQIHELLNKADTIFDENKFRSKDKYDVPEMQVEYYIESAFRHTLVLLDKLNLTRTYDLFMEIFSEAQKKGMRESEMGIDEPYLKWSIIIFDFLKSVGNSYNTNPFSDFVIKDIKTILRATLYSITDKNLFSNPPDCESEVHSRIEAVLKCVFPNLKHKPVISKPIKNFVPDTGLPSVRTLIEYKFVSNIQDVKRISDEVLADTRGYFSREWEKFIYVIYEVKRIKQESEWVLMLKECGVPSNTEILVLQGE